MQRGPIRGLVRNLATLSSDSARFRMAYAVEKQVAISAVARACALTSAVFNKLVQNETLVKGDKSPVTVADFSAQALVCTILKHAFPTDPIVGEEDAADLRANASMAQRIAELANDALNSPVASYERSEWGIGPSHGTRETSALLDAIDRGTFAGGKTGRMWTLDPIDGTKGFLRGEQYAVCLALIVDSKVKLGVMGCPNLPVTIGDESGERGCLFVAVEGEGAEQVRCDLHAVCHRVTHIIPSDLCLTLCRQHLFVFLLSQVGRAHFGHLRVLRPHTRRILSMPASADISVQTLLPSEWIHKPNTAPWLAVMATCTCACPLASDIARRSGFVLFSTTQFLD